MCYRIPRAHGVYDSPSFFLLLTGTDDRTLIGREAGASMTKFLGILHLARCIAPGRDAKAPRINVNPNLVTTKWSRKPLERYLCTYKKQKMKTDQKTALRLHPTNC